MRHAAKYLFRGHTLFMLQRAREGDLARMHATVRKHVDLSILAWLGAAIRGVGLALLTLLEPQSRFGDKILEN